MKHEHEHAVEVKLSPPLQETFTHTKGVLQSNKRAILFGIGGLAIGIIGTRIFSRPMVNVVVQAATPN